MIEEHVGGVLPVEDAVPQAERSLPLSVARAARCRCPACGRGRLFGRFLKVEPVCQGCGLSLSGHRADDFPPYVVMFIVGHLVGYAIYVSEVRFGGFEGPAILVWAVLALALSLLLLQPVKGAVVGLQYALGMHGFSGGAKDPHDGRESTGSRGSTTRDAEA